jgi:hypothetical protein
LEISAAKYETRWKRKGLGDWYVGRLPNAAGCKMLLNSYFLVLIKESLTLFEGFISNAPFEVRWCCLSASLIHKGRELS